jgi:hypothetical protein
MSTTPTIRTASSAASALTSTTALRLGAAALALGVTLTLLAGVTQIAEVQARNAAVEVMSAQAKAQPAPVALLSAKPSHRA